MGFNSAQTLKVSARRQGGYTVYAPALPGCVNEGDARAEALANIRQAIELYLEPAEDDHLPQEQAEVVELAL